MSTSVFSDEVQWNIGSRSGPTVAAAASSFCSGYEHCTGFQVGSYIYDPTRMDLLTVTFLLGVEGDIWTRETAQMVACTVNCSVYNYSTGITVCVDGFYSDSANHLGWINTCDRPNLQECSNGELILQGSICPIAIPVCTDFQTCQDFALTQIDCSNSTDVNFVFVDQDNWDMTCTTENSADPEIFGCNGVICGGIATVSNEDNNDTTNTDNTSSDQTSSSDSGSSYTDTDQSSDTSGSDSGSSSSDSYQEPDVTYNNTSSDSVTVVNEYNFGDGPCDPTQPDYYSCLDPRIYNLPNHSETISLSFSDINQDFTTRISNSPIVTAFSGMSTLVNTSGASCPEFSITFPAPINHTASTDIHCVLLESIKLVLGPVMIVVYVWVGFRIFASA
jgi:hypothetical protein